MQVEKRHNHTPRCLFLFAANIRAQVFSVQSKRCVRQIRLATQARRA
ncbi:hypothetical protein Z949_1488 [Sulfitobacter guttiformis KCTC 32187]|nr:hypothetical protein Z949_1488 [Sulfitobacter guttiformis KCTC 32187]